MISTGMDSSGGGSCTTFPACAKAIRHFFVLAEGRRDVGGIPAALGGRDRNYSQNVNNDRGRARVCANSTAAVNGEVGRGASGYWQGTEPASQSKVKPNADVRDVFLEELPIRRRAVIELQHERDESPRMATRSRA
jgi:hypothetical protein